MKYLFTLLLLTTFSFTFLSQELTNEKIWNSPEFSSKSIYGFNSMEDGFHFSKLSRVNDSLCITKHKFTDYKGKGETILNISFYNYKLSNQEIDGYQFNKNENKLLLTTNSKSIYRRSYEAIYFLYDLKNKKLEPLSNEYSPQTLVEYSPDGSKVSFIHKNNIFIKYLETNTIQQITFDGAKNKIINGTTDWVYEEEFAITKAYYWSPDSKTIAFLKFDESNVKEMTMEIYGNLYPELNTFKYPKAGEDNSKVTLHIYEEGTKKITPVLINNYEYIPRLKWTKTENILIVQTLNRHQNQLDYHKIHKSKNTYQSAIFHSEKSETYIEIDDNLEILSNNSIVFSSEKDGYKHLYLINLNGELHQITSGKWDVIDFYGVSEKNKTIFYSSSENGAINKTLYSISISGKTKKTISESVGYTEATFSTGMNFFVKNYSTANSPNVYSLCDKTGKKLSILEDNQRLSEALSSYRFNEKTFFKLKGATDLLNASIILPKDFDSTKKYPVYVHVYGGPGNNIVLNQYKRQEYLYHQLLAQKGHIVLSVDPRGTMYRGVAFKKASYLQLGKLELEDIIAATQNFVKEFSFADSERLGIQGWSFGGYLTSLAMTKGNGLFKLGIAVAPVTNWEYYDNIYTERFMRTPAENKSGYSENSPINFAKNLEGKYLIIHGTADDNVHLQNSIDLIEALIQANKDFTSFLYPNKNHSIYGGNTRNHLFNMMLNFTLDNL